MSNTTGSRSSSITLAYVGVDSLESVFSKSPIALGIFVMLAPK